MVKRVEKRSTFLKRAKTVETNGVEPLEEVAGLSVLGRVATLLDKTLDFLKARDDSLVARGAPAPFLRLGEIIEFRAQRV